MSEPLITIGITAYREGEWLRECWESVLAQTDDRWEAVLVLDGGHDERTREVFDTLEHPKLRKYAFEQNVGPFPARNKAFELTRTPYHFYLDGDDQLLSESVALVLRTFERQPDAEVVYGDYQFFGGSAAIRRYPAAILPDAPHQIASLPGSCAYQKGLWKRLGGFSDEFARGPADTDFLLAAWEARTKVVHCGAVYYRYRAGNPASVSRSQATRLHVLKQALVRRHPRIFADPDVRRRYIALGYRASANACATTGRRWAAIRYALVAMVSGGWWCDRRLWKVLLIATLPAPLVGLVRRGWRAFRAPRGGRQS